MTRYKAVYAYCPLGPQTHCTDVSIVEFKAENDEMAVKILLNWKNFDKYPNDLYNTSLIVLANESEKHRPVNIDKYLNYRDIITIKKGFKWKIKNFRIEDYWI